MARCAERACVNQAMAGGAKCLPHRLDADRRPKVVPVARGSLRHIADTQDVKPAPVKPSEVDGKDEFEIVPVASIPSLVIKNPKNHRIVNAIAVLKDGNALKVTRKGNARHFSHTIQDACRKRGIKGVHSRRSLESVYFWKDPETKSAGAKS